MPQSTFGQVVLARQSPLVRSRLPLSARHVLLIQRLTDECLDYRLTADIQLLCSAIEFFEHAGGEVNVHPLHRALHPSSVREEPGNILTTVCKPCDRFGGWF
jgi:hypothetical protein